MSQRYQIALVPGDGIGPEIIPPAWEVLQAAAERCGIQLEGTSFPFGAGHYLRHGAFMPPDGLQTLRGFHAIFFGAVGLPAVDDRLPAREFTFRVRSGFRQYVNYRPVKRYAGVTGPLRTQEDFDFVVIRENTEGEFTLAGSEHHLDAPEGFATQLSVFTRRGITRVARYAFELARRRRKRVTNVTKSNTLIHSLAYWDRVIAEVAREYPDVLCEKMYVDNAAANLVLRPERFDVLLTSNMIGDILSDLGGALMGSLGMAPSGNLNPEREFPSMFEPIHGSAPDIAGRGIANPVGAVESGALMLEHLGEPGAGDLVRKAVAGALRDGVRTPDLAGDASTAEMCRAILQRLGGPA